jgi:hypothetical protein
MAGRKQLVEVNAKVTLGETSAALIGPGRGSHPHVDGAICDRTRCDHVFVSALMLRRIVPNLSAGAGIWLEIGEGLKLVWENRTLGVSPGSPVPGSFCITCRSPC